MSLATRLADFATAVATNVSLRAPKDSPTFTGTVTVPTPATTAAATTKAYVDERVSTIANVAPGSYVTADYVFGATNAYPARPTTRTDITVVWRGPTAPTIGGTAAMANDEWKVKTA